MGGGGEVGTLDQQQVQQGLWPHDRPGARTTPDPSALRTSPSFFTRHLGRTAEARGRTAAA